MNIAQNLYPSLKQPADRLYSLLRDRVITARMVAEPESSLPQLSGGACWAGMPSPGRGAITTQETHSLEAAPHLTSMLTSQLAQ